VAASEFLLSSQINRFYFTQYSQGSVAAFSTQFNTDWGGGGQGILPATVQALATTAAPTVAIVIINGQVLTVNPTDWIGYSASFGWQVYPNSVMAGSKFTPTTL
jgi:hypothetical protein